MDDRSLATARDAGTGQPDSSGHDASRHSLRGSSLLLLGRLLAIGINFVAQVLVVRVLSTKDFGAFAYALTGAALFDGLSSLGLVRGISRFAPIYHEKRDWDRLFGTIVLVVGTTLAVSALVIATLSVSPHLLGHMVRNDSKAIPLLLIVMFLIPLDALDEGLAGLFACFTRPRAIFYRKHVLAPGLKLAAVGLLIVLHSSVKFLAWADVVATLFGVSLYAWMLVRLFRRQGLLEHFNLRTLQFPFREVFAFTLPLLTSDLVNTVMSSASIFFLGGFHDTTAVAHYRAIVPAARLNALVMTSFGVLYMPQAARLFARGDIRGIDTLYWRTAVWVAVLSFPIFALTFSLAKPLTTALYGERYAASAVLLQLLAFGHYFNASTGFNGLTLKVLGKLRYIMAANLISMAASVGLCALLVPRFGPLGAAIATLSAMVLYNILKQAGLGLVAGLQVFDRSCLGFYALLSGGAALLALLQIFVIRSIWTAVPAAALAFVIVLWASKERLHVEETFPEILRVPVLGAILRARFPRVSRRGSCPAVTPAQDAAPRNRMSIAREAQ